VKSAVERGLSAVFYTFSRKTSSSTINVSDEAGYAIFHHAALHNRVSVICQLWSANFNVNQRRFIMFSQGFIQFSNFVQYRISLINIKQNSII
jgi:hypothetical protein